MHSFRFIHTADIHLDSPLLGLESRDDAPIALIRNATRQALENLVALCLEEQVSFLLIAGDVYDGAWRSVETGRFFARQMLRLANADPPIPVFLVKGNHDAESALSREIPVPTVHTFSHRKAATQIIENLGVAVHGQSYARPDVSEDLSLAYPPAIVGMFNVGLLHTCAVGRAGHERYAPCDPGALARKGYQYWALGHIHKREILCEDPPIVFSGNLQGRHVRERDPQGKGCTMVTVEAGEVVDVQHVAIDVVRWDLVDVGITGCSAIEEVLERIGAQLAERSRQAAGRLLAARIRLIGSAAASLQIHLDLAAFTAAVRERIGAMPDEIWLEQILVESKAPILEGELETGASLFGLLSAVRVYAGEHYQVLKQETVAPLAERLRASDPDLCDELELERPDIVLDLMPEVEQAIAAIARGSLTQ